MGTRAPSLALAVVLATSPVAATGQSRMDARATDPPLPAQAIPTEAELRARLDSLHPLLQRARADRAAEQDRIEAAERQRAAAAASVDTLRVGPMRVITPSVGAERARRLFSEVWAEGFADIQRSPALEAAWFPFQWSDELVPIYVEGGASRGIALPAWTRREQVKEWIAKTIAASLTTDLRSATTGVGGWVNGDPFTEGARESLADVYRTLATTQSRATRACLAGDVTLCAGALGLGLGLGTEAASKRAALQTWYVPAERQSLVRAFKIRGRQTPEDRSTWERCVSHDDIGACDELLVPHAAQLAPLPGSVRASLLATALDVGGEGAWERAVTDPARSPERGLEEVSGLPLDELVAIWRLGVLEHRTEPQVGLAGGSGLALAWSLLFASLALRSTRWRLG